MVALGTLVWFYNEHLKQDTSSLNKNIRTELRNWGGKYQNSCEEIYEIGFNNLPKIGTLANEWMETLEEVLFFQSLKSFFARFNK